MRGCKFCAIGEGKEEASVVYEDEITEIGARKPRAKA